MEVRYLVADTGLQEVVWESVRCADDSARGWWDYYARPGWWWHRRCVSAEQAAAARPPIRPLSLPVELRVEPNDRGQTGLLRCRVNTSSALARVGNLWSEGYVLDLTFQLGLRLDTRPVVHLLGAAAAAARPRELHALYIDFGHTSTACLCLARDDPARADLFRQRASDWGAYAAPLTPSRFAVTPNRWEYRFEPFDVSRELKLESVTRLDQMEAHPLPPVWEGGAVEAAVQRNPKAGLGDAGDSRMRFTVAGGFADLAELAAVRQNPERLTGADAPGRAATELALRGLFRAVYHELHGRHGLPGVQTIAGAALPVVDRVVLTAPAAFNDWARRDLHAAAVAAARAAAPHYLGTTGHRVAVEVVSDEATCITFWATDRIRDDLPLPDRPGLPLLVFDCGGGTTDISLTTSTRDTRTAGQQAELHVTRWFDGSAVCAGQELLWGVIALAVRALSDPDGDTRLDFAALLGFGGRPVADRTDAVPPAVRQWGKNRLLANPEVERLGLPSDVAAAVRGEVVWFLERYAAELVRSNDPPPLDLSGLFGRPGAVGAVMRKDIFPAIRLPGCGLSVSGSGQVVRSAYDEHRPGPRRADRAHEFRLSSGDFADLFPAEDTPAGDPFAVMLEGLLGPLRELTRRAAATARRLARGTGGPAPLKGAKRANKKDVTNALITPANPLRIVFAGGGTQIRQARERVREQFAVAVGRDRLAPEEVEPIAPTATDADRYLRAKSRTVRGLAHLDLRRGSTPLTLERASAEPLTVRLADALSGAAKPGDDALVFAAADFEQAAKRRGSGIAPAELEKVGLTGEAADRFRSWLGEIDEMAGGSLGPRLPHLFPDLAAGPLSAERFRDWRFLTAAAALRVLPSRWVPLDVPVAETDSVLAFCLATDEDDPQAVEFLGRFIVEGLSGRQWVLVAAPVPDMVTVLDVAAAQYKPGRPPDEPGPGYSRCRASAWPAEALPSYMREG